MKNFLGIEITPSLLERSISGATTLKAELPTDLQMESILLQVFSSLTEEFTLKHGKRPNKPALICVSF